MLNVVVAYEPGHDERELIEGALGKDLVFLSDLSDLRERAKALEKAFALLSWNPMLELKPEEYEELKSLKFMQLLSAGADHVPFSLVPPDVTIASNVGAYAEPIAEHAMALVLTLAKRLMINHQKLSEGEFDQTSLNISIRGSACGILGFGAIGKATARLMRGFGARILAINRSGKTEEEVDFVGTLDDLDHVLASSDILVISLPLSRVTRGLIGKRELEKMKERGILVNVARADILDEKALYDHLKNHPDFMAGTDVWWVEPFRHGEFREDYPLLSLPNFLGSPHNSAMVPGTALEGTRRAVENILRFIRGEPISGLVRREDYVG